MNDFDPNRAIFTLKQIVNNSSPILYVVHDREDEWQFLSNENVSTKDLIITKIDRILSIDSTIKDILWLPQGMEATREAVGKVWITKVFTE